MVVKVEQILQQQEIRRNHDQHYETLHRWVTLEHDKDTFGLARDAFDDHQTTPVETYFYKNLSFVLTVRILFTCYVSQLILFDTYTRSSFI